MVESGQQGCNLCGSTATDTIYEATLPEERREQPASDELACTSLEHRQHHQIVRCTGCGLVFARFTEPDTTILAAYEAVVDPCYVAEREGRIRTFHRVLHHLHRHARPPGRMLDIGCHIGTFLDLARRQGWQVDGLEPSAWAVQQARQLYNLELRQGAITDTTWDHRFDAVCMWDVIEHLVDPRAALDRVAGLLEPGAVLGLSTMDLSSSFARLAGRRWPWLMRMHLYYFTPATITEMLRRAGLETVEIRRYVHVVSLGYLLRKAGAMSRLASAALRRLPLDRMLRGLHVPFSLGDFMEVYARKPHVPGQQTPAQECPCAPC